MRGKKLTVNPKSHYWIMRLAWINAGFCLAVPLFCLIIWLVYPLENKTLLAKNVYPVTLVVGTGFPIVGAIILARLPKNIIGWIFNVSGLLVSLSNIGQFYAAYSLYQTQITLPGGMFSSWFFGNIWLPGMSLLVFLPQLFPTGRPLTRRWQWLLGATVIILSLNFIGWSVATWPLQGRSWFEISNDDWDTLLEIPNSIAWGVTVCQICSPLIGVLMLASLASLMLRFWRSQGVERLQLKWVSYAICLALLMLLITIQFNPAGGSLHGDFFNLLVQLLTVLAFAAVPTGITIAILKYRLYDINLLINRTLVYFALTAFISGFYIALVDFLSALLQTEGNLYVSLFATGLVAVIFNPLRNILQRMVNRVLYGNREEPYKIISRLSQRLEGAFLPEAVLSVIVETVAEALKLPYTAIELEQDGEYVVAASAGTVTVDLVRLPLVYQASKLGYLVLALRQSGEAFNPTDRQLLEELARQAGIAAYAVMVTADLQRSRERLVTSREDERRRMRRDLHDGLGPVLASMTLVVDAIRLIIPRNREQAETMLIELKRQLQSTVSDIRRLVYELRPPVLDELGLIPALQQYADQISQQNFSVEVKTLEKLPALSAALEVAIYRIVQEALTNVVKHSGAHHAQVQLKLAEQNLDYNAFHLHRLNNRLLEITVRDDGKGYPEKFQPGIGLHSMRERTAELGGTLQFENSLSGGACVKVQMPFVPETMPTGRVSSSNELIFNSDWLKDTAVQEK